QSTPARPVRVNVTGRKPPAPVDAHPTAFGGPFARSTTKCTFAPTWVTSTVPNGAVPQPPVPEQWSDVKSKVIADADVAPPAMTAATVSAIPHFKIFMDRILLGRWTSHQQMPILPMWQQAFFRQSMWPGGHLRVNEHTA